MLRVIVAPDKFKWSLSAADAARAMARGVRSVVPTAEVDEAPMADGGEGTAGALVAATRGTVRHRRATGPLGEPIDAEFGVLGDGATAVIEMAAVSGLKLVPTDRRDPSRTTTRGTGELLVAAIESGVRRVILGIGGSATNDGGAGLGEALGFRLLDASGRPLEPGGGALDRLARIDPSGRDARLDTIEIQVACDVDNPLCGPRGASAVYGPQKGADPAMIARLDQNLAHFAHVVERDLGASVLNLPGGGAAGGLGAGLVAFAGGKLGPGVDLVIEAVGLRERLRRAELCLTGEGAIDASSAAGKTAVGVARVARSVGCPTLAFAGTLGPGAEAVLNEGVDALFSLCPGPISLDEAIARAGDLLERSVAQALRAFLAGRDRGIRHE